MTHLLYLDEPHRRTANATVAARRGSSFILDKTIFSPGTSIYRHPQPPDRGEAWVGGDKRWLRRVGWRRDELLHTLDGAVPEVGESLRLHLYVERRETIERAHAAMHLVVTALARTRNVVLTESAHVQGGGHFTLCVRRDSFSPEVFAKILEVANAAAGLDLRSTVEYRTRDALRGVDEQPFDDGLLHPGPEGTLRVVRIGDASALPCDGTVARTTKGLGHIVLQSARPGKGGMRLQFRCG